MKNIKGGRYYKKISDHLILLTGNCKAKDYHHENKIMYTEP